ncbi:MAG: heavy-metal-associated domain-containing protein, partial [Micrococcales bacterium]|nr:heavy-metal-associated domain-containing protein [Micrococcales bacterium]
MAATTYLVSGMTCDHCVHHVTTELDALPGVTDVAVELVSGGQSPVTVTSDEPLDESLVAAAVAE